MKPPNNSAARVFRYFRPPLPMSQDAQDAAEYWKDKEFKKFAVDVVAGKAARPTFAHTYYVQARTADRAIAAIKRDAISIPAGARYSARLAGPRELGCTPTA